MSPISLQSRPRLARKARVRPDPLTGRTFLLYPERGLLLDEIGAEIVSMCTAELTVAEMVERLAARYEGNRSSVEHDLLTFLQSLAARGLLTEENDP